MAIAYIGLGSNMAEPVAQLQQAIMDLNALPEIQVLACSSLYSSAPIGYLDQPDFVNAVAKLDTMLSPKDLLNCLLSIEQQHGRERTFRNAPRTLDLDVLLYDQQVIHEEGLTLPHPQMHLRAFVLLPLLELDAACLIPNLGPAHHFVAACCDQQLSVMTQKVSLK